MKPNKITAHDLKLALLEYFRFTRQWVCVDECMQADVVADAGNHIIEVEVKVSKADLLNGEKKKQWKHNNLMHGRYPRFRPNKYYFCVPRSLKAEAIKYALSLNEKYGVIAFDDEAFDREAPGRDVYGRHIFTVKSALLLHGSYSTEHAKQIAKRASSKLITLMRKG